MNMNRKQIMDSVQEIFRDLFDIEDLIISEDTTSTDIEGWDSIQQIALIDMIEKKYSIHFTIDEIVDMANVGEMINRIENKLA